jgi:hypothetical protein
MVNAISEENAVRAANEARRFRQARSRAYPPLARMIPTSRPFTRRARKLRSAGRRCSLRGDRRGDGRAGFASRRRAALDADRNHGQRACQRAGSQIRGGDRCRIGGGEARRPAGRDSGRAARRDPERVDAGRRRAARGIHSVVAGFPGLLVAAGAEGVTHSRTIQEHRDCVILSRGDPRFARHVCRHRRDEGEQRRAKRPASEPSAEPRPRSVPATSPRITARSAGHGPIAPARQ